MTDVVVTTADLAEWWRPLTADEEPRARAKLRAAVAHILALASADVDVELVRSVACSMVERAMSAGASAPLGASQTSWSASPYGGSVTWSNPSGDLYLTKQEMQVLGIGSGLVGTASLLGDD